VLFGFGIFYSLPSRLATNSRLQMGGLKEFHFLLRDYPMEFGICLTLGLACWIAYFSIVAPPSDQLTLDQRWTLAAPS